MNSANTSLEEIAPEDRRLVVAVVEKVQEEGRKWIDARLEKVENPRIVWSWTSLDENSPATASMVRKIFEQDELRQFETMSGLTDERLVGRLAILWPQILKRLAPLGKLPADRILKEDHFRPSAARPAFDGPQTLRQSSPVRP